MQIVDEVLEGSFRRRWLMGFQEVLAQMGGSEGSSADTRQAQIERKVPEGSRADEVPEGFGADG